MSSMSGGGREGFWSTVSGRSNRYHWFPDVARLSGCGNRFVLDLTGRVENEDAVLAMRCVRCDARTQRHEPRTTRWGHPEDEDP